MAKKNYYAVRNGREPGIYRTWDECRRQVEGFPGALYKGFTYESEALEYMKSGPAEKAPAPEPAGASPDGGGAGVYPLPYAFVDGSYNQRTKTSAWGGFLVLRDGTEIPIQGSTTDPEWTAMRNVAGEVLGCWAALMKAWDLKLKKVHVYYDYMGIQAWPEHSWQANKPGTKAYTDAVGELRKNGLEVVFHKVAGHTGIPGNEKADRMAKQAAGIG